MFKQKYELSPQQSLWCQCSALNTNKAFKKCNSDLKKKKTPNHHLCHIHVDVICDIIFRQKKNTPQLLVESN